MASNVIVLKFELKSFHFEIDFLKGSRFLAQIGVEILLLISYKSKRLKPIAGKSS